MADRMFQVGDRVRVVVEAEITELWKNRMVLDGHDIATDRTSATVKLLPPTHWPPRVDDLWRGADGVMWFAMKGHADSVLMTDRTGGRHGPEYVIGHRGPLTLIHREQQPQGVDDEDDPRSWVDALGNSWDLQARYVDPWGARWHWAGGFQSVGEGPLEPMWSRDDWSIQDVPHSRVIEKHGMLREQQDGGETP